MTSIATSSIHPVPVPSVHGEAARLAKEIAAGAVEASSPVHYEEMTRRVRELAGLFKYGLYSARGELVPGDRPVAEIARPEYGSAVASVDLSPDGRVVAISGVNKAAHAISLTDNSTLVERSGAFEDACKKVRFENGSTLLSAGRDKIVRSHLEGRGWLGLRSSSVFYDAPASISDFDMTAGGRLAVASSDCRVRLVEQDPRSSRRVRVVAEHACVDYPERVAVSARGDLLLVAEASFQSEPKGRVAAVALDEKLSSLGEIGSIGLSGRVSALALSPDGHLAAVAGEYGELLVAPVRGAAPFAQPIIDMRVEEPVSSLDFHLTGSLLALSCGRRLLVWSMEERGEDGGPLEVASFRAESPIASARFSADGSGIVVAESSGKVWVFPDKGGRIY